MELPQLVLPSLPSLNLAFVVNSYVLSIILIVFAAIYFVISSVLFYHWETYGLGSRGIIMAETLFVIVSVVLFIITFLSVSYF